ncbi:MAG: PD40 domain-containing protein [Actinobacteria bacterium]|nr:PD40 domain-containing protein [Actinomycetota bacterium]MBV8395432.1 PD40 domain-containing protein [Actinomycetota bacterium]
MKPRPRVVSFATAAALVALVAAPGPGASRTAQPAATAGGESAAGLIAFARDPDSAAGGGGGAIFTAKTDGSDIEQLTEIDSGYAQTIEWYPTWSPDGTRIAFLCVLGTTCQTTVLATNAASELVGIGTGESEMMTQDLGPVNGVGWCPGGSPAPEQEIVRVSPDRSRVAIASIYGISINAYGAAAADQVPDFRACGGHYVLTVNGGTNITLPTQTYALSWSPDGTRIAIQAQDGLYIGSAAGGPAHRIFTTPYGLYPGKTLYAPPRDDPAWSPDGRTIAFVEPSGTGWNAEGGGDQVQQTNIWTIGADGSNPKILIRNASEPSYQPKPVLFHQCSIQKPEVAELPLDADDQYFVAAYQADQADGYRASLQRSVAQVTADESAHPSHRSSDQAVLARLEQLQTVARSLASAAGGLPTPPSPQVTEAERQLVRDAACGLVSDAVSSLKSFIDETDTVTQKAQAKELVDKVDQFGQVLTGKIKPDSIDASNLLKANIADLVKQFAGDKAGKYVSQSGDLLGKAADLFRVLKGTLTADQLSMLQQKNVSDLVTRIAGKDAGDLANQLTTFARVISGNATEDQQFTALKTAFVDLSTRLLGRNIMTLPQVRAAMLGFQIGTALGQSIAANLKIIATAELKRACLLTLAKAQHVGQSWGEVDFDKPTTEFVTIAGSPFEGWSCTTVKGSALPSSPGHGLIEAVSPVKIYAWVIKTGGETIYFDPAF